jgi:hypothetical protein
MTAPRQITATYLPLPASLARHPDYGYLFVIGTMALETVYGTTEQFRGYELVEPADYNSVIALAGSYMAFYFFNHNFASPNYICGTSDD